MWWCIKYIMQFLQRTNCAIIIFQGFTLTHNTCVVRTKAYLSSVVVEVHEVICRNEGPKPKI